MSLTGAPGEEGKTMEAMEGGSEGKISGGKFVHEALIKEAKASRGSFEVQKGDSGPTSERPRRRRSRLSEVEGQHEMAWLKVSSSFRHLGQCLRSEA